jgi:MFS family permease
MQAALENPTPNIIRRLTATLFAGQSIASLGMTAAVTVGSIAATHVTGTTEFAGVPTTLYVLGGALGAFPAGKLMDRYGRRAGLAVGFLVGVIGAGLGALALIALVPFALFLAHALMGMSRGALDQGRFAAADMVTQQQRARAVSWVVLGGAVGGILGPLAISPASRWATQLGYETLAGPYLLGACIFLFGSLLIFALLRPDPRDIGRALALTPQEHAERALTARNFFQALHARNVQIAVAAMVLGQVVMTTVMVMTPLQMTEHLHHSLDEVSIVIAAHVTGMYLTSLFTGRIADRVGHAKTILIGASLLIGACLLAPFSSETLRLAFALFVLGAGWNFCYVAGSSLLTDSIRINERGHIQGSNDLLVGLVAATGSLLGGVFFERIGYQGIAVAGITLALTLFGFVLIRVRAQAAPVA